MALSDGKLSAHLGVPEARGYVAVRKEFRGRKPHTLVVPTEEGRAAFQNYLMALERIIRAAALDAAARGVKWWCLVPGATTGDSRLAPEMAISPPCFRFPECGCDCSSTREVRRPVLPIPPVP